MTDATETEQIERAKRLHQSGDLAAAETIYQAILDSQPDHPEALHYLGLAQHQRGRHDEALRLIARSIESVDDNPKSQSNMGFVLYAQRRFADALPYFERAIDLDPNHDKAYLTRGFALVEIGEWFAAEVSLRRAIDLSPTVAEAQFFLGRALREQGKLSEAVSAYRQAIALKPSFAEAHANLGNLLRIQGDNTQSIAAYREALRLKPDLNDARSKLLITMNYPSGITQTEIEQESAAWGAYVDTGNSENRQFANSRDPDRQLRVGFVSPDLRTHSVSYFLEPLLREISTTAFATYCYAELERPDETTKRLQDLASRWRETINLNNEALENLIIEDGIDILIDLAGHTQGNRLAVFARRPAPVQATWLGYPNTTGLAAMDYRIVDAITDPDDSGTETLVRMPSGFLCYQPPGDAPSPRSDGSRDSIVFGSFNNTEKLSDACVELWASVLEALPASSLLLKSRHLDDETTATRLRERFERHGIGADRLRLCGQVASRSAHLEMYAGIDVCLDPTPYNGTTTTFEALWMGVPVVTLAGDHHRSRVGASILRRIGLDDLVAASPDAFVEAATLLAHDKDRRHELRQSLRDRMAPLCDARRFAEDMECVLRRMWKDSCGRPVDEKT